MIPAIETSLLARPAAISDLTGQVLDILADHGVDDRAAHHVAMALEELLTNLGTHGNCADVPARVRVFVEQNAVKAEVIDTGPPFDPREAPDPDLSGSLEDRQIGGLGLFLIRQFASEIDYTRGEGANRTSFAVARSQIAQHGR